jgi:hypothetical protein
MHLPEETEVDVSEQEGRAAHHLNHAMRAGPFVAVAPFDTAARAPGAELYARKQQRWLKMAGDKGASLPRFNALVHETAASRMRPGMFFAIGTPEGCDGWNPHAAAGCPLSRLFSASRVKSWARTNGCYSCGVLFHRKFCIGECCPVCKQGGGVFSGDSFVIGGQKGKIDHKNGAVTFGVVVHEAEGAAAAGEEEEEEEEDEDEDEDEEEQEDWQCSCGSHNSSNSRHCGFCELSWQPKPGGQPPAAAAAPAPASSAISQNEAGAAAAPAPAPAPAEQQEAAPKELRALYISGQVQPMTATVTACVLGGQVFAGELQMALCGQTHMLFLGERAVRTTAGSEDGGQWFPSGTPPEAVFMSAASDPVEFACPVDTPAGVFSENGCSPTWRLMATHFRLMLLHQRRWYHTASPASPLELEYYVAGSAYAYDRGHATVQDASAYAFRRNGQRTGYAERRQRERHLVPIWWFFIKRGRVFQAVPVETVVAEAFEIGVAGGS